MTVINFEKYSEAVNPHMHIKRHIFGADMMQKKSVIFITIQCGDIELQCIVGRSGYGR